MVGRGEQRSIKVSTREKEIEIRTQTETERDGEVGERENKIITNVTQEHKYMHYVEVA